MLVIRHLEGPLAGSEQTISDEHDHVMIGRDPDTCEIVYPVEDSVVGRRHCQLLRQPSGDWVIDLFGDHYVEIDGVAAEPHQPVRDGSKIRLGRRDGPKFQVMVTRAEKANDLPQTSHQEKPVPVRILIRRDVGVGLGLLGLVVLGAGGWVYSDWSSRKQLDQRFSQLAKHQEESDKDRSRDSAARISDEAQARLARSVYLVILRDEVGREFASGTAWPVGKNLLATNAHITELRTKLKTGETMVVRSPGLNGRTYEVKEHVTHPGYHAFPDYINGRDPVFISTYHGRFRPLSESLAYDVGLLRVEENLPAGDILEIAPTKDLKALTLGVPLASAGYPTESITGSEVQTQGATPELHFGNISALTDYFSLPADSAQAHLIHHTIGTTGGSSGSPIIGTGGRVVALVNAGNFLFDANGNRIPNAALINYAQRADILADLIAGRADAALAQDREYWDKQLAGFKRGIDVVIPLILDKEKPSAGAKPVVVVDEKSMLGPTNMRSDPRGKSRIKEHVLTLKRGVRYVIVAYAERATPIKLYIADKDNNILAQEVGDIWYPYVAYTPSQDGEIYAYVSGPDSDTNYVFLLYRWESPAS